MSIDTIEIVEETFRAQANKPARRRLPADPERSNKARSVTALTATRDYQGATDCDPCDAVADLLCDLRHMCDRHREYGDFEKASDRADYAYLEDTAKVGMYVEVIEVE